MFLWNSDTNKKKRKTWNRLKELLPSRWKRKLAKSDKGSYYNQYEYGKGPYYNKHNDDDLDLVTNDESSSSGESEGKSHNDSVLHEMFFTKENLSTLVNAFIVCKFFNSPIQEEEDSNKLIGLACFLKIVCQNEKCLKSKINSSVNMSNKNGQSFEINCLFVLACPLIGHGHSAAKKLTSVLNMT